MPVYPDRATVKLERNILRDAMKKQSYTIAQLASRSHTSVQTVTRARNGSAISLVSAALIAGALSLRISELWPELKK